MRKNVAREIKVESNIVKLLLAKHRGIVRFELNVLESHKRQTMIYRQTRSAPSVFRYRLIAMFYQRIQSVCIDDQYVRRSHFLVVHRSHLTANLILS